MVSVRNASVCCFEGRLYDPTGGLSADNACDPSRTKRSAYPLQIPNLIARRSISPPSFDSCQESLITLPFDATHCSFSHPPQHSGSGEVHLLTASQFFRVHAKSSFCHWPGKSALQRPPFEPSRYLTAQESDHVLRVETHTEFLAQERFRAL